LPAISMTANPVRYDPESRRSVSLA
jgi:hypothetical protein